MTPINSQKKLGGQKKHWAERIRTLVWYYEIKKRSINLSDYRLDYLFAWTDQGVASRSKDDNRPRTFEWIRKLAREPKGNDKLGRWRGMTDLIETVDQHPIFRGTKNLYMSGFWDILLERHSWTPSRVEMHVESILEANGLIRVNHNTSPALLVLIGKYGHAQIFNKCLIMSLRQMSKLSGMELVWLVYLQTEPTRYWSLRAGVESIADEQLEEFFYQYFPIIESLDIYSEAIETFQRFRLDMSELKGYGYLQTTGDWPIIPKKIFDDITVRHNSNI